MVDIARIGFSADTNALKDAKADLTAIIPPAERTQKAADKASASLERLGAAGNTAAAGVRNVAMGGSEAAQNITRLAEGYDVLTGKINGNFLAIGNNMQRLGLLDRNVQNVGKSLKLTAAEGLAFTRQFADIGVTAAMGMNPLMIALQQGPQLFDILQMKAIQTGSSIGAVARSMGAEFAASFARFLPAIGLIGTAIGTVAGAFALATRAINKGNEDLSKGMGLTEKQLERVKKAGVDTAVTMGDTFAATFDVLGDRLYDAFKPQLDWLGDAWNSTMDFITQVGADAIKITIGLFLGFTKGIAASWKLLPAALGDAMIQMANLVIKTVQDTINFVIGGINQFLGFANSILGTSFSSIGNINLAPVTNQFAGAGADFIAAFSKGMSEGMSEGFAAVDKFFDDVGKRARERREKAIKEAAGDAEKGSKGRKGGKTNAEKFGDLVGDVTRDIAMTEAQTKALGLSADAALRMTNEQKLLNDAQAKGIVLTDKQRAVLLGLAGELTDAQIALRNAEGFKAITEGLNGQLRSSQIAGQLIGKYGEDLDRSRIILEAMNDAISKNITLTDAQIAAITKQADAIAKQNAENAKRQFLDDMIKKADMDQFGMERERGEILLTGAALEAYRYETEMLLEAKRRGIVLSEEEIAAIHASAEAYGKMRHELDLYRERMAFMRDTTKGFFTDMINGLRQGQTVWQAFANAVVNALNKIIDKLMDQALNGLLNSIFGGIGSALGGGGGGGFDFGTSEPINLFDGLSGGALPNAKGNAFTNGIYNTPTLFSFGKGTALGQMGEAGPEAVMPLHRGPDGSLGVRAAGASSNSTPAQVTVVVRAEEGAMFVPRVEAISQDKAVQVVQAGIQEYDYQMPQRVQAIAADERAR